MSNENEMCYIGKKPCGCHTFAVVDCPERAKEAAKETGRSIRNGETVSRISVQEVRTMPWKCDQHKPVKQGVLVSPQEEKLSVPIKK